MDPSNFTECWNDDERMNFLFSAFPANRSVNPHHWDSKMSFWTKLVSDLCMHSPHAYMSWDNLFSKLLRHGKHPLGLQVVFDELITRGLVVSTPEYTSDIHASESWVGWGLNWCVKRPVSWMAGKVLSPMKTRPGRDMKTGQFVMIPAIQHKCDLVMEKLQSTTPDEAAPGLGLLDIHIISFTTLRSLVKNLLCDEESLDLVLATLKTEKRVEVSVVGQKAGTDKAEKGLEDFPLGEKYIKFAKKSEKRVAPFSEADTGIVKLRQTKTFLEKRIDQSYDEIKQCTEKARKCLKNNQRSMVKNLLRKRKRIEGGLEKSEQTLSNIEQLLDSIHQCKTDKMVMDTYQVGIAAYHDLSEGLSESTVLDTMDDVAAVLESHADIRNALAAGGESYSDNSAVEAELADLLQSDGAASNNGVDDLCANLRSFGLNGHSDLPDVPTHSPKRFSNGIEQFQTACKMLTENS